MSTINVALADAPTDAPTDVLVHLVDHGPANLAELVDALAPPAIIEPARTVSYAIDLLRRIGYLTAYDGPTYRWCATDAGRAAIAAARLQAQS